MVLPKRPVADAHVDVLWRMAEQGLSFADEALQAGLPRLRKGCVRTQVFALFVHPSMSGPEQLQRVLREIDLFYTGVAGDAVLPVRTREEWAQARAEGRIAGLLSLEGGGCLSGDLSVLRILFRLGVRGMGLTWNPGNELADGCREPRGAGLTAAGRAVVLEMERLGMWIDIAHLADAGVHDILRCTDAPVMASHANAWAQHPHPRNLTDDVIREIVRRRGWIGVTLEASFLAVPHKATVDDVFRHIDHFLYLGAENCLGFGSDFDGTSNPLPGLSTAADYQVFADLLVHRYGETLAHKLLSQNLERFLYERLPADGSCQAT